MKIERNVIRNGNQISIQSMGDPKTVGEFIFCLTNGIKEGTQDFVLSFKEVDAAFPNVSTPIAGIIETVATLQGIG